MEILVSVLMCVYNTPLGYLRQAIESILDQSYQNFEFIIVDDASDDIGVQSYLESVSKQHDKIKLIHNSYNCGLTRSLNTGLTCCNGKYVVRMDSDDISLPCRIEKQILYLESNPDISLLGCNTSIISGEQDYADDAFRTVCRQFDFEIYRIRSLIQHSGPAHPTFVFRRDFLVKHEIRYDESILKAQDYGIMVEILKNEGKIAILQESLLKYRIHKGQISAGSEREQKIYQSKVSAEYIGKIFPELETIECIAISLLGNDYTFKELIDGVKKDSRLSILAAPIIENENVLEKKSIYIDSVKRLVKINNKKNRYDGRKFEMIFRGELWRKMIRRFKESSDLGILDPYVLLCFRYARKLKRL